MSFIRAHTLLSFVYTLLAGLPRINEHSASRAMLIVSCDNDSNDNNNDDDNDKKIMNMTHVNNVYSFLI